MATTDQRSELEAAQQLLAEAEEKMVERAARWEAEEAELAAKTGPREVIPMVDEAAEYLAKSKSARKRPAGPTKPGSSFGL